MLIGERLKGMREDRNLSQADIEKRTGLLRVYISRVENGHTVPAIETLEKFARSLEVPLYALFYDGEKPPKPVIPASKVMTGWGSSGRDARTLRQFRRLLKKMDPADFKLLFFMAQKLSQRKNGRA